MTTTAHDAVKHLLAERYGQLASLRCHWCQHAVPIPQEGVVSVVTEYRKPGGPYRADVAALDANGLPLAVMEVIDTNPPANRVLAAQEALPAAFYVGLDALAAPGYLLGYCSGFCYRNRNRDRLSCLASCWDCQRCFLWLEDSTSVSVDYDSGICLECAAASYSPKGGPMLFSPEPPPQSPAARFSDFATACFWAMVWGERSATADASCAEWSESETTARLWQVLASFDAGDWDAGKELLLPIGQPWDGLEEDGPPLYAWERRNTYLTAKAWARLRDQRRSALPAYLQTAMGKSAVE